MSKISRLIAHDAKLRDHAHDLLTALEELYECAAPEGLSLTADDMQRRHKQAADLINKCRKYEAF